MALGLRSDGRRAKELRKVGCDLDVVSGADGSCLFTMGRTKVIATVFGPQPRSVGTSGASSSVSGSGAYTKGKLPAVELKVTWAPFATQERRERGRTDRFIVELEAMLKATVGSMLDTHNQAAVGEALRFDSQR